MADTTPEKQQTKHRACDECRSRKLACSKEPDGCARCKKEGVACHYSLQKPMGRPRKRPCPDNEATQEKPKQQQQSQTQSRKISTPTSSNTPKNITKTPSTTSSPTATQPTVSTTVPANTSSSTNILNIFDPLPSLGDLQVPDDLDWSLLDNTAGDMGFLDYMNLDPNQPFDPDFVGPEALSLTYPVEEPKPMSKWQFGIGGLFDGGTFDQLSLAMESAPLPVDNSTAPSPDALSAPAPSLSSGSCHSSPDENPDTPTNQVPVPRTSVPCVCLANMYLALDKLQHLPTGVRDAMCAARYGARVAHDCMQCSSCSQPMVLAAQPPIQCLQNMMILGALLPVIANAYMHIVPMVDKEAEKATAERRKLFFAISEFGGVWGRAAQQKECSTAESLQGDMEPTLWRQIVRALLKFDVYGMDGCTATGSKMKQIGLRDVVDQMEERSITRHRMFEHVDVQSTVGSMGCPAPPVTFPGQKPTCLQIIGMAKQAVENIVIA
ncbi:putative c6 finger domain-containing protein [Zalerion maritima]|uniref:C6 finger domain-containing protein n=1 Tax=Zalerion maritima TaxID=339359 RepID=A0AAD5RG33_9PEZI|nr:putative c6 finger domain-containing protein [Zalerion maritima]